MGVRFVDPLFHGFDCPSLITGRRAPTPSSSTSSWGQAVKSRELRHRSQLQLTTPLSKLPKMSGTPPLPRCTDPPSLRLPVLNCAAIPDEGAFSHNGTEVREHLCPTLDRLLRASCSQLSSPKAVASLLASELGLLSASARPSRAIDPSQPATLMTGHCDRRHSNLEPANLQLG